MRRAVLSWLVLLAFSLAGCGGQTVLAQEDNGATVEVGAGDEVTLQLAGNPTTGYAWSITTLDESYLQQQGEPNYECDSDLIGAGGMYTFRFKALRAGQTTLALAYARSFEPDKPPEKTFEVEVVIK